MKRILMFPEPFPDEDFRSIIFRYHLRSANFNFFESKFELFGTTSYKQTVFPRRLNYLMEKLPLGNTLSKDLLLYEHTWYGLYKVFYMPERINRTMKVINGEDDNKNGFDGLSQWTAQSVLSTDIKYCPLCVSEDEEIYGEVYVHRGHQIDFLKSCPKHNVLLASECTECGEVYANSNSGMLLRSRYCDCGSAMKIVKVSNSDEIVRLQYELYNDLVLLRERHMEVNVDILYHQLIGFLYRGKYISLKNIFYKKKMIVDFITYYSVNTLEKVNISVEEISTQYFYIQLFKRDSMSNFISFYLLLIRFFASSLDIFLLDEAAISSPIFYGNGPWACKNSRCENYNLPLIKKCVRKIGYKEELYRMKYSCNKCGYSTMLRGADGKDHKLICFKDKNVIPDSELDYVRPGMNIKVGNSTRLNETRGKMVSILEKGLNSRKKIRNENDAVYIWLMRHDREWLQARLPPKTDRKAPKTDFAQLDNELLIKIKNAARTLDPNYPIRITKQTVSNLLEATDRNRLKTYRASLLPLSYQELEKYTESRKDFLIRSIPRFYQKFVNHGITSMNIYQFKSATATFYQVEAEENIEIEKEIYRFLEEQNALIQ
ncbi:TnsD family Tn7-like transposition protein [Paenibacillus sp. FSL L8-0709]|uniref:TnsD family Tn7-like transposition protein n=1 Tax=Paenibacillus sp. FSL L8-0709 TaxID=2975312 RepID=UPI0030F9DA06